MAWAAQGLSFVREVQPVLDRYCVSCHDGSAGRADTGPGPEFPNFKGDEMLTYWKTQMPGHWPGGGKFTGSYWELQRFVRRPGIEGDRRMFTPMDYHFSTTELGQLLRKGHHGVQIDAESHERLAAWADLNAPFYGTWGEVREFTNGYGHLKCEQLISASTRALELRRKFVPMGPFPDYEKIPETPRYDTTPVIPKRRGGANAETNTRADSDVAFPLTPALSPGEREKRTQLLDESKRAGRPRSSELGQAQRAILPRPEGEGRGEGEGTAATSQSAPNDQSQKATLTLGPGVTLELVRIPGGQFVMGSTSGHADESPRSRVPVKPF